MADFVIDVIEVSAAAINPNPVDMSRQFVLSVRITESTRVLEPEKIYLNEVYMGEVW